MLTPPAFESNWCLKIRGNVKRRFLVPLRKLYLVFVWFKYETYIVDVLPSCNMPATSVGQNPQKRRAYSIQVNPKPMPLRRFQISADVYSTSDGRDNQAYLLNCSPKP